MLGFLLLHFFGKVGETLKLVRIYFCLKSREYHFVAMKINVAARPGILLKATKILGASRIQNVTYFEV